MRFVVVAVMLGVMVVDGRKVESPRGAKQTMKMAQMDKANHFNLAAIDTAAHEQEIRAAEHQREINTNTVTVQYRRHMDGIKLYFKLKGMWNETRDVDPPFDSLDHERPRAEFNEREDCKVVDFPAGCVSIFKMAQFLEGKWIPGYESTSNPRFVEGGHYMLINRAAPTHHQLKNTPGYDMDGRHKLQQQPIVLGKIITPPQQLMNEMAHYILSRPVRSVPEQCIPFFLDPGEKWPGETSPTRESYLPAIDQRHELCTGSPMMGAPDVCVPYREQDIDRMPVAAKTMQEIEGEEEEEEGELQNSAIFRKVIYVAMALMGVLVPTSLAYFFARSYVNSRQVAFRPLYSGEAVMSAGSSEPGYSGQYSLPGSAGSRVEDMRRQLLATHNPLTAQSSMPTGLLNMPNPFGSTPFGLGATGFKPIAGSFPRP